MRLLMTAFVFGIPETKMRCISPHVGGAFGTKIFLYPEYVLVAALAEKVGRPVKWIEIAARELHRDHARPRPHHLPRGRREARRHDHGAQGRRRTRTSAASSRRSRPASRRRSTAACSRAATGSRRSTARCSASTRTRRWSTPTAAPAGPRRPTWSSARWTSSRASSGMDPVEVRRRNFIPPDAFPYDPGILAGLSYDSGEYEKALDRALEIVDYDGFRAEQAAARAAGPPPRHRLLDLRRDLRRRAVGLDRHERPGLGRRPVGERERARPPHRQGRRHDRLASRTGRATRRRWRRSSPTSSASRSRTSRSSTATRTARRSATAPTAAAAPRSARSPSTTRCSGSRTRRRRIAAHMLEADPEDIVYEDGRAFVVGSPDTGKTIQEIAAAAAVGYDLPAGRGAVPRRHGLLRPAELHVPVRHARRRGRGRRRDGRGDAEALRRGRRRRAGDQPDDRRRPGARRHRAGRRAGALGGRGLRRERPAPDARA